MQAISLVQGDRLQSYGTRLHECDSAQLVDALRHLSGARHAVDQRRHKGLHVAVAHHAAARQHRVRRRGLRGAHMYSKINLRKISPKTYGIQIIGSAVYFSSSDTCFSR